MLKLTTRIALVALVAAPFAAHAAGGIAPGTGSFEDLSDVKSNQGYTLVTTRRGKTAPLGIPKKVAFTQVKDASGEKRDAIMILRNTDKKNFRFQLPDFIKLGNMDNPLSYNGNKRLSQEGDRIAIVPGARGTGQDLGVRLTLENKYDNTDSYRTTESCTITREREVRERVCFEDENGNHKCETRWVTRTIYIDGSRRVTKNTRRQGASYTLQLFDSSWKNQMTSDLRYAKSRTYTTNEGPCRPH